MCTSHDGVYSLLRQAVAASKLLAASLIAHPTFRFQPFPDFLFFNCSWTVFFGSWIEVQGRGARDAENGERTGLLAHCICTELSRTPCLPLPPVPQIILDSFVSWWPIRTPWGGVRWARVVSKAWSCAGCRALAAVLSNSRTCRFSYCRGPRWASCAGCTQETVGDWTLRTARSPQL